jgi:hypothetical protein
MRDRVSRLLLIVALLSRVPVALVAAESSEPRFGFGGPEIFPVDVGIDFLRSADLDGDGRNDLVVVNNARSKITLLYNQTGRTNAPAKASTPAKAPAGRRDINELPPDARFRIDSISSEKRISSLVVADLNGDNRPDLAYFGEPKELVVQINQGTNAWSLPRRIDLGDGLLDANALTSGDINGDRLPDLLLLAEKHVHILLQRPDHSLADAVKLPYTGTVKAVQVHDIDGDGRQDLLLVNWDHPNPFRFRLQDAQGQLGPETHLPLAPVRSYTAEDLDGDRRTEFVTIAAKSGRAAVSNVRRKKGEAAAGSLMDGPFAVLPLPRTDKSRRGVAWADINGDRRPDLLVADPEGGQLLVHMQQPDGTLASPKTYPAFSGITDIACIDWDGDGAPELFLLSPDEKQVGLAKVEKSGRVAFPGPLPLPGKPLAMAAGILGKGEPIVAVVTEREERRGKDGKADAGSLREIVLLGPNPKPGVQSLSESFKGNPTAMAFHDADQDGLPDIVILTPYEKIKVLRQRPQPKDGQRFEEIDVNPPGGTSDAPWLALADADADGRPELLLAQKNFVRAVVLHGTSGQEASWNFTVRDQINGASSSSRIVGAAALPIPGSKSPALFLFDADRKGLTLCTRNDAGVWQAGKTLSLPVTDFASLAPLALGDAAAGPNAIAFLGANGVAWKQFAGESWELGELDGYETPIKDGFLHDVIAGDLNQDGRLDLVFLETSKAYVDIVTLEKPHRLNPATRWQVFEERTFRQRRPLDAPEPREALVAELTGDGKPDLVLLVHDRILLYPQE